MFGSLILAGALVGFFCIAFLLTVMFDDKQRYDMSLKGFIKWLREAGTDYKPDDQK